jgi:hypothetical protein
VCGRVVGAGEARWLDFDLALALAHKENERSKCSGCGHDLEEALDKATQGAVTVDHFQCHYCAARDRKSRELSERAGGARPHPEMLDGIYLAPRHD